MTCWVRSFRSSSSRPVISASGGDPVTAVELEQILEHFTDKEDASDVATNNELWGDDTHLHELPRTAGQRRHDAIVAIFWVAVASGEPGIDPGPQV
jgi:hypothetical protein